MNNIFARLSVSDVRALVVADHKNDWRKFAKIMFGLQDADPGYMLLNRAEMDRAKKLRYVLAWCAYYNPGIAAKACDYQGKKFYDYLHAVYPTAKRASERRHFRGRAGYAALEQWQRYYPAPEAMVEKCFGRTYLEVRRNMEHMAQMGDYFYWKLADIQDTVFGEYVDFTGCEKYMPKVPKQGAAIIHDLDCLAADLRGDPLPVNALSATMMRITDEISQYTHPFQKRRLALQEAETVCCVFKQHYVGDYRYGFRTAKAVKRLEAMQHETKTAKVLLDAVYSGPVWRPELVDAVKEYL